MNISAITATAVAGVGAYTLYSRSVRLESAEPVNHNTKRLRFALPDPNQPTGLSLTSAVLTISWPNGSWLPTIRPYTPINDINKPGFIELLVKHYPGGKQSTHLHSLKPNDSIIMIRGVPPGYRWTANQHPHVALIAGGAGITPMYQLTRGILNNPEDKTKITLVWGVNSDADIFLREEFSALEKKFPGRFRAVYVVSNPEPGSPHPKGYVDKQILDKTGLSGKDIGNNDTKIFVCGPPAMEKALTGAKGFGKPKSGILTELGYTPAQIHRF
ncbi:hypothetical protein DL770_001365 [Monosporascus sp. CRB-9-2]|nr:hypothetical protein DL770_001365 [Monosporascus sp. CRB-9-2]